METITSSVGQDEGYHYTYPTLVLHGCYQTCSLIWRSGMVPNYDPDCYKGSMCGYWDTCVLTGNIGASYAPGEIRNTLPNGSTSKTVGNKDGSGRIADRDECVAVLIAKQLLKHSEHSHK